MQACCRRGQSYARRSTGSYHACGMRADRARPTVAHDVLTPASPSVRTLVRRDETLAIALAVVLVVVSLVQDYSTAAAIGGGLTCLPLAVRTRAPLAVLATVTGASLVYLSLTETSQAFVSPLLVALYTVAVHGSRRRSLMLATALPAYVGGLVVLFSPAEGSAGRQIVELLSQLGIALAVGEAVRSQRALLGAMRERAERAERDREVETSLRVDEERMRIARDVHDVVAHSIATIATQAAVGAHLGAKEPEKAVALLSSIKEVSTAALHDLRDTVGVLREPNGQAPTSPAPSVRDVAELVRQARSSGLAVVLQMQGSPAALPTAMQIAIYRIVQESLTNVMRHADGAQTTVRIAIVGHEVEVDVTDDGRGTATALSTPGTGSGLIGMRERASSLGGELEAGRAPHGGWRVHTTLPLDQEPA
jgi:signal transduction histidine kinase